MHDAFIAFRECGWASFLCLLIGMLGLGVVAIGLVMTATRARRYAKIPGGIALALGLLSLSSGVLGRQIGFSKTEAAVSGESVDPSQRERILAAGREESNQCVKVGAATGALPFLLGALVIGLAVALRPPSDPSRDESTSRARQ